MYFGVVLMATNQTQNAPQIILNRGDWRRRLVDSYTAEAQRLDSAYRRTVARLELEIAQFNADLAKLEADGTPITSRDIARLSSYTRLLNATEAEMNAFARVLEESAATVSDDAVGIGSDAALQMTLTQAGNAANAVRAAWQRPAQQMIAQFIGYADTAARLGKFNQFGANARQNMSDVLIAFTAQGKGSTAISGLLNEWFNVPRSWGENIVRTMQAYSYRGSSIAGYRANPNIVTGWMWWAALDHRVCPACLGLHGSIHTVDEELNGHHRCRCTPLPIIRGSTWQNDVETGEDWLRRQGGALQKAILGKGGLDLWQKGTPLDRFRHEYEDDLYGMMVRTASLKEIRGSP